MPGDVQIFDIGLELDAEINDDFTIGENPKSGPERYEALQLREDVDALNSFGDQLGVLEVEITNRDVLRGNTAVATVVFPDGLDPSALRATEQAGIETIVKINITTSFTSLDRTFGATAFTGELVGATEDEEGSVRLELAGITKTLTDYTVALVTQKTGQRVDTIVRNLLRDDAGLTEATGLFDFDADFVISIRNPKSVTTTYGTDNRETLRTVLIDLAKKQDAFVFVDASNRINFVDHAISNYYAIESAIKVDAGNEDSANERVIVKSSYDVTGISDWTTTGSSQVSAEASAGNGDAENRRVLRDDNLLENDVESRAASEFRADQLVKSSGRLTIPGFPGASPNDQVVVPKLGLAETVSAGTYTAREVVHRLNGNDGFVTELQLGPGLDEIYEQVYQSQGTDGVRRWTKPELTAEAEALIFTSELFVGGVSDVGLIDAALSPKGSPKTVIALLDAFDIVLPGLDFREPGIDRAPDQPTDVGLLSDNNGLEDSQPVEIGPDTDETDDTDG